MCVGGGLNTVDLPIGGANQYILTGQIYCKLLVSVSQKKTTKKKTIECQHCAVYYSLVQLELRTHEYAQNRSHVTIFTLVLLLVQLHPKVLWSKKLPKIKIKLKWSI